MKKRISAIAIVVICLAILATGTVAYFTDTEQMHNFIASGNIEVLLEEIFPGAVRGEEENTYVLEGVMPGQTVEKMVRVKNTGVGDAWIRAKLTLEFDPKGLSSDVVNYNVEMGWIDGEDGWYYHMMPVASGAYTDYIIKEVGFAPEMGNDYQGSSATLSVEVQAVQVANNMPESGLVTDVSGWPAN